LKFQILKTKCGCTEKIFISILGLVLCVLTYKIFSIEMSFLNILIYLLLVILFLTLAFLAYYDIKKMEVHNTLSFILMAILLIVNIVLFFVFKNNLDIKIIRDWIYNPYENMIGALILGSIFQLIVLLSKEKALGQGDVRIAIIAGLLIGYTHLIYWGYITVFSALIYGLIVGIKRKKIKEVKIPFVPFMMLGVIVLLLYFF